jgi:hypothetical protein
MVTKENQRFLLVYKVMNDIVEELAVEDKESFKNFTRMSTRTFDDLLAKVGPKICRQNTTFSLKDVFHPELDYC